MEDKPPLLIQQQPRLSEREAERTLDDLLSRLGIKLNSKDKRKESIVINQGTEREQKKRYSELTREIRTYGVCVFLHNDLDRMDTVFGGTFGISTPNWQMRITTEWAGYRKELEGPCRSIPSEIDISDDIEFYKEETCIESSEYDFEMCFRNYRGYLFSSIALIDSYINRHIVLFDFNGLRTDGFNQLKSSRNTEERIELFVDQFCQFSFSDFKQSNAWRDFKRLKNLRNEMVHSLNPYMGLGIKEIATNLNLSIHGVGTFLRQLQEGQNRITLGFIERVRTSPVVHFNQVTLRADGKHKEIRHFTKKIR